MPWQLLLLLSQLSILLCPVDPPPAPTPRPVAGSPVQRGLIPVLPNGVDFGPTMLGVARDTVIRIYSPNNGSQLSAVLVTASPRQFQIGQPVADSAGLDTFLLAVRFRPDIAGEAVGSIFVSRGADTGFVTLAGSGDTSLMISSRYHGAARGDTIDFGERRIGDCDSVQIEMTNASPDRIPVFFAIASNRGAPFSLRGGTVQGGAASIDTSRTIFTIYFCPQDTSQVTGSVTVRTPFGIRTFVLHGHGTAPRLVYAPLALDFASADSCRSDTITVSNTGVADLIVSFTIGGADSARIGVLDAKGFTVPSGTTQYIVLTYCGWESAEAFVRIATRDSVAVIPIHIRASGWLSAAAPFDFNDSLACESQSQTLRNLRNAPITISTVSFGSGRTFFKLRSPALPMTLDNQDVFSLQVEFCPLKADSVYRDTLYLYDPQRQLIAAIPLRGILNTRSLLVAQPTTIAFGRVPGDSCVDRLILLINRGNVTEVIDSLVLRIQSGSGLTIPQPPLLPYLLAPQDTLGVVIRYCPSREETLAARLSFVIGGRDTINIPIAGSGLPPDSVPIEEQTVWIDSTRATAGETLSLRVHLSPGIPATVSGYSLRFSFDPKALYPIEAIDVASSAALKFNRDSAATGILLLGRGAGKIAGTTLLELRFRGLSTGHDSNLVTFTNGVIDTTRPLRAGAPGLVRLFGCDIGRPNPLERRASIRTLTVDGSQAVLRFTAPVGMIPILRLTSTAGDLIRAVALPAGSGAEQATPVDLRGVPPGFYILELRVGDGRSSIPLMIAR